MENNKSDFDESFDADGFSNFPMRDGFVLLFFSRPKRRRLAAICIAAITALASAYFERSIGWTVYLLHVVGTLAILDLVGDDLAQFLSKRSKTAIEVQIQDTCMIFIISFLIGVISMKTAALCGWL